MKEIALSRGMVTKVDDCDFYWLSQWDWIVLRTKYTSYAIRQENDASGRQTQILMHRQILGFPEGLDVDHINGDGTDNQRNNIRACTTAQNMFNRRIPKNNRTGYKGVSLCKSKPKPFHASIQKNYKTTHLGYFDTPEGAAEAYNRAAMEMYGEFARLNVIAA